MFSSTLSLADANVICGASEEQKMICLKETENRFNKKVVTYIKNFK